MSTDTRAIIGTIVGTGLVVAGLLSAQVAGVNVRVNDARADLSTRVDEVRADMREMRASMERLDSRLDAVEVAFGKVEQRLDTLERVLLPSREPVGRVITGGGMSAGRFPASDRAGKAFD